MKRTLTWLSGSVMNTQEDSVAAVESILVSIVIPSLNGKELLPKCLDSLACQTYDNVEVLLVDNGSTDGSGEFVRQNYPSVNVIRTTENLGFAGGCNLGASKAEGEYVLFLSNDTAVAPSFLEVLVRVALADPLVGLVQSKILQADNPGLVDGVGSFFTSAGLLRYEGQGEPDTYHNEEVNEIFAAMGAAMMVRRTLFERLGGFDDDYEIYFEDVDLSWRIWLAGYRVVVATGSVVYHIGNSTTNREPSSRIVFLQFRNRLCTLIKSLSSKDLLRVLPVHLLVCLAGSSAFLLRGNPRVAKAVLAGLLWNVLNLRSTLEKRRVNRKHAAAANNDLFPRLERPMPIFELISSRIAYLRRW